jgi:hypothetical protein
MTPEQWDVLRECVTFASRANTDSAHNRILRRLLAANALEVAEYALRAYEAEA